MRRLGIVAVGLAVALALGGLHRGTAQSSSPPPASVFQNCMLMYPGSISVTIAWPPTPGALQQWVDLTLFDNGFQPGTFLGEGPMIGRQTFTWIGIAPELPHFYRVNVLYPDGWVTVASGSFVSIGGCPKPTAFSGRLTDIWCNADSVDVTFMWTPADGDSQWLDLAESPEAMALGSHHAQGPLSPDTDSYRLRIPTSTSYWWRVNTHSAAGWSPSPIWSFTSAYCGLQAPPAAPPPPPPTPPQSPPPLPPPPILLLPPIDTSDLEWVYLYDDLGNYKLIVVRANRQAWLIEYGVGCISMWRYERDYILVYSPGLFAGIGSRIILPDQGQDCRIWYSKYLG